MVVVRVLDRGLEKVDVAEQCVCVCVCVCVCLCVWQWRW